MDQRQDAEQGERQVSDQRTAGLDIGVFFHFDCRHRHADQVNIEHHPLFQAIEHQQHRAQVHAQCVAETQVKQRQRQRQRGANSAKRHHAGGERIPLVAHLPDAFQQAGVNAHPQQADADQRLAESKGHQQQHGDRHGGQSGHRPVTATDHLGIAARAVSRLFAAQWRQYKQQVAFATALVACFG
ncbi:hypothetical protein D3C73_1146360 [compost metagenome]